MRSEAQGATRPPRALPGLFGASLAFLREALEPRGYMLYKVRRAENETVYNQHKLRKPQILCFGALLIFVLHSIRRPF